MVKSMWLGEWCHGSEYLSGLIHQVPRRDRGRIYPVPVGAIDKKVRLIGKKPHHTKVEWLNVFPYLNKRDGSGPNPFFFPKYAINEKWRF